MYMYDDFQVYESGIYQHDDSVKGYITNHDIKIIGYGEENGVKYWIVSNSWNDSWGEKGFFRILRGVNNIGIETSAYAGDYTGKKN